jgi:hypothetical protein
MLTQYSRILATSELSMNIVWIILSIAIAGVIAKWATLAAEGHMHSPLGFVSHQWLADHRLSQVSDPQR